MNEELHQIIKEIKTQLRLSMNGIVSTHQRRQGLDYKINFGVEIPRLKEIAARYTKNETLAEHLWTENIRESKLLAIYLYPQEKFGPEVANRWLAECRFTETADHLCRLLLIHLPEAPSFALRQIESEDVMRKYCGYSILSNLFRSNCPITEIEESGYLMAIKTTFADSSLSNTVKNAAAISLIKYAESSECRCEKAKALFSVNAGEENTEILSLLENI
ncbi:MAG: DNA alkylation repair protein [Bacteroidaceae bacterium]|nr:DNA alkylation repair protein [Bacteroidaceae bacterium]MBQ4037946.1 DNA alkylation repair protein [Bacteroidaceae bacterium]